MSDWKTECRARLICASQSSPVDHSEAVLANLNINLKSAILVLTELIAKFQKASCRKILFNISFGAALKAYAGWSIYCASKAGMEGYIRALAAEPRTEPHPFTAINVDPGVINTEMQALIRGSSVADFPEVARCIQRKHQAGLVAPQAVAASVLRIFALPSLSGGGRYETSVGGA